MITDNIKTKLNKLIITFILIQPILDITVGITQNYLKINFTISSIIRLTYLLFSLCYLIKNKKNILTTILFIIYIILFSITTIIFKDINTYSYEIKNTLNTFYLPITLLALQDIIKKYNTKIELKYIYYVFLTYILLIIIPTITHTGFNSYSHSKEGNIGWFISANAIGNTISILLPFIILFLIQTKNMFIKTITPIITIYTLTTIGTKVPILSLLICLLAYLIYYITKWTKQKNYKNIKITIISSIVITITSIIMIPKTSFYKNIQIHKNYLGIDNYIDILKEPYLIDHFVFSQRLTFLKNTNENYKKANIVEKLVGIGYIENYGTDKVSVKTIEMDYFEIFYRNGILGFIIFFTTITPYIIKQLKSNIQYKISTILILLLSLFSGHILIMPSVSIFVALILIGGIHENIKERQN